MYAGALLLTAWLLSIAAGPDAYAAAETFLLSWAGRGILFAFTGAAMFHMFNGIRHLFWDAGKGFAPGFASGVSVVIILAAAAATVAIWFAAYAV